MICDAKVVCFFVEVSLSATFPKSPIFFHNAITLLVSIPVAFEIALIANLF